MNKPASIVVFCLAITHFPSSLFAQAANKAHARPVPMSYTPHVQPNPLHPFTPRHLRPQATTEPRRPLVPPPVFLPVPIPMTQPGPVPFEPFTREFELKANNGEQVGQTVPFNVPPGKMLVIEQVSARVDLPVDQSIGSFVLSTQSPSGAPVFFIVAPQAIPAFTSTAGFIGNGSFRIYAGPQSTVFFGFGRDSARGNSINGSVTISGYVMDWPGR